MRRLGSVTTVLLSVLALGAGCALEREDDDRPRAGATASTAPDEAPTARGEGALRLEHAAEPLLFRAGDGLALLAVRADAEGTGAGVVAASYDGSWSAPEELSAPGARTSTPRAALNDDGVGVAVWTEQAPGDDGLEAALPVVARLREADGSWSPSQVLDGLAYVEDVQVNARGDVAVHGYPDDGPRRIALHPAGGSWSTADLAWYDAVSIALDEDGGVHAALTGTERGGGGAVSTQYLPPGGEWTAPEQVETGPTATEPVRILVLPGGGEALVVGTVSPHWQSTYDTQSYWSTAVQVLRRPSRDEPFVEAWTRDGAARVQARVRGDGVELAWLQQADGRQADGAEGPVTVPTTEVLTVATVGGREERLAATPVERALDDSHGTIEFAAGNGCAARAFVWRPVGVDDVPGELVAEVTSASSSAGAGWGTTGDPVDFGVQGALACAGGDDPWVARVDEAERAGSDEQGDLRLVDATVVVDPLH